MFLFRPQSFRAIRRLHSPSGVVKTSSVLVVLGVASAGLVAVLALWLTWGTRPLPETGPGAGLTLQSPAEAEPVAAGSGVPASNHAGGRAGFFETIKESLRIERVDSSADLKARQRGMVRKDFRQTELLLKGLKKQGLQGEALYQEAQRIIEEASDLEALKLLEGIRSFEQEMAEADFDGMSAEERWAYRRDARRAAFGEEMADMLFFKDEALEQYRLQEHAILGNAALSEEARQEEINKAREDLKMKLASRGGVIVFPDERARDLEARLRGKYGEGLDSMSEEERRVAAVEMLRASLPPEVVSDLENANQEANRASSARVSDEVVVEMNKKMQAAMEAGLRERYGEAVDRMSDEELRAAYSEMLRTALSPVPAGQGGQQFGLEKKGKPAGSPGP